MRTNFQEDMDCIELQSPEISDTFCWYQLISYIHIYIYYYIFINIIYQHIPTNPTIVSHIFTSPASPTGGFQGRLGEGGLATVFRAWDCKGNLGKVAVTWIWWVECFLFCVFFMSNVVLFLSYWVFIDLLFVSNRWIYCNRVFLFSQ